MQTFAREDKLMLRPACSGLTLRIPGWDQSMRLQDPGQRFIMGKFLFKLSQGIKVLPAKLIFLFLVIKSVADYISERERREDTRGSEITT